jgi:hypothetical protein
MAQILFSIQLLALVVVLVVTMCLLDLMADRVVAAVQKQVQELQVKVSLAE